MTEAQRIGEKLKQLRESQFMTQDKLAELTGIKQTNIHRIEKGLFDIKVSTVARILNVFGKSIEF